jgi:hypothetical protein
MFAGSTGEHSQQNNAFVSGTDRASIARIKSEGEFMGTGILVAPDYVLTCDHVVRAGDDELPKVTVELGEVRDGRVVAFSDSHDLALIHLAYPVQGEPVQFVAGLKKGHTRALLDASWEAVGYSVRDSQDFLRNYPINGTLFIAHDESSGSLLDAQSEGGLPEGISGSPLFIETAGYKACVGMAYYGGEYAAKSRVILADCIVGFLEYCRVNMATPIHADDFLGRQDALKGKPRRVPPVLGSQPPTKKTNQPQSPKPWIAAGLAVVLVLLAGLIYWVNRPRSIAPQSVERPYELVRQTPNKETSPPKAVPRFEVTIRTYMGADTPRFSINGKIARPDQYDPGKAVFNLAAGSYEVRAEYPDQTCIAFFSVPAVKQTEAQCHLN